MRLTDFVRRELRRAFPAGASVAGDLGYDTTSKRWIATDARAEAAIWRNAYCNISDATSIASTAAETDVDKNYTFPANSLVAYQRLRITGSGVYGNTGTPTARLKLYLGANTLFDSSGAWTTDTGATTSNARVLIDCEVNIRSATQAYAHGRAILVGPTTTQIVYFTNLVTIDTTIAQACKVAWKWGTSASANTMTWKNFSIEIA